MPPEPRQRIKCAGTTRNGEPCPNWALVGSGHCRHHANGPLVAATAQNTDTLRTALPTIEQPIFQASDTEANRWRWAVEFALTMRSYLDAGGVDPARDADHVAVTTDSAGKAEGARLPLAAAVLETEAGAWKVVYGAGATETLAITSPRISEGAYPLGTLLRACEHDGIIPASVFEGSPESACIAYAVMGNDLFIFAHPSVPLRDDGLPDYAKLLPVNPEAIDYSALETGVVSQGRGAGILPFHTGIEFRTLFEMIARAVHGIGIQFLEPDLNHKSARFIYRDPHRKSTHEVIVEPSDKPWGVGELQGVTQEWGLWAMRVTQVVAGMLSENLEQNLDGIARGAVAPVATIDIDAVLKATGARREDSAAKWNQLRREVRHRLLEISWAAVSGERRETYKDEQGRVVETKQRDALFTIADNETAWLSPQQTLDDSGVPLRLRVLGGSIWERYARSKEMQQYLGDVRALAKLPFGQPAGQWAYAMACSIIQEAREKRKQRLEMSRFELLMRFPPRETPQNLWDKKQMRKIRLRYNDAKARLLEVFPDMRFTEPPELEIRFDYLQPWLEQRVIIDVGGIGEPLPELAQSARKHREREQKALRSGRRRRSAN